MLPMVHNFRCAIYTKDRCRNTASGHRNGLPSPVVYSSDAEVVGHVQTVLKLDTTAAEHRDESADDNSAEASGQEAPGCHTEPDPDVRDRLARFSSIARSVRVVG